MGRPPGTSPPLSRPSPARRPGFSSVITRLRTSRQDAAGGSWPVTSETSTRSTSRWMESRSVRLEEERLSCLVVVGVPLDENSSSRSPMASRSRPTPGTGFSKIGLLPTSDMGGYGPGPRRRGRGDLVLARALGGRLGDQRALLVLHDRAHPGRPLDVDHAAQEDSERRCAPTCGTPRTGTTP